MAKSEFNTFFNMLTKKENISNEDFMVSMEDARKHIEDAVVDISTLVSILTDATGYKPTVEFLGKISFDVAKIAELNAVLTDLQLQLLKQSEVIN